MRVNLVVVAPTTEGYIKEGEADYLSRLKRLCTLQREELNVKREWGRLAGLEQREREAPRRLAARAPTRNGWVLDAGGVARRAMTFSMLGFMREER